MTKSQQLTSRLEWELGISKHLLAVTNIMALVQALISRHAPLHIHGIALDCWCNWCASRCHCWVMLAVKLTIRLLQNLCP